MTDCRNARTQTHTHSRLLATRIKKTSKMMLYLLKEREKGKKKHNKRKFSLRTFKSVTEIGKVIIFKCIPFFCCCCYVSDVQLSK